MRNFINNKLVTQSQAEAMEYDAQLNGDGNGILEAGSYVDGDAFDMGMDMGGFDFDNGGGFDSFGGVGDRSGVKGANDWHFQGQPLKTFFMSPLFMVKYIFQDLISDFPKKEEWVNILKVLNTVNIFCILTAILAMALGVNTIFSPSFQLVAGLVMHISTTLIIKYGYKEDTRLIIFLKDILNKGEASNEESKDEDNLFGEDEFGLDEFGDDLGLDMDEAGSAYGALDDSFHSVNSVDSLGEIDEYEEAEEDDHFAPDSGLKDSPISVESDETFQEDLLEVFAKNDRYMGKQILDRIGLVHSFSDYLIQNSDNFGKWVKPKEGGIVYNNIAYALYKALCKIETQFDSYQNEDKMHVIEIKESPLLYRIELELPNYFKEKKLQSNVKVIEDVLRASEDDLEVSVLISTFQGNIVIKLLRIDNKQLVSLGDILRFNDDEKGFVGLDAFANDDYGLPVLLGLQNNENPYVVDWESNTSGTIIGGSGSGKSWTTFEMMLNFVISNDYNNVNFVVLDAKNAPFWNAFARFPHVLGYHTDPMEYIDILREVEEERKRRQDLLNELGAEDMKGYRKSLRRKKQYDKLKEVPLLFLVIDEITATMAELKQVDEDLFKTASGLLGQISAKGRSAGVRILSIGQRSTYDSVPKTLLANSSFKFGMKMEVQNDFITLFGDDVKKYKTPNTMGMGLSKTEGTTTLQTIKTLTIGGTNNEQMLMLIRTLAFDWIRRSYGNDNIRDMPRNIPLEKAYNRNEFYDKSIKEMTSGRILIPAEVNEGYEVIFPDETSQEEGHKIKAIQERLKASERKKQERAERERKEKEDALSWTDSILDPFGGFQDTPNSSTEIEDLDGYGGKQELEDTEDSFDFPSREESFGTDNNTFNGKNNDQEIEFYKPLGDFGRPTIPDSDFFRKDNNQEDETLGDPFKEQSKGNNLVDEDEYEDKEELDDFLAKFNFPDIDDEDDDPELDTNWKDENDWIEQSSNFKGDPDNDKEELLVEKVDEPLSLDELIRKQQEDSEVDGEDTYTIKREEMREVASEEGDYTSNSCEKPLRTSENKVIGASSPELLTKLPDGVTQNVPNENPIQLPNEKVSLEKRDDVVSLDQLLADDSEEMSVADEVEPISASLLDDDELDFPEAEQSESYIEEDTDKETESLNQKQDGESLALKRQLEEREKEIQRLREQHEKEQQRIKQMEQERYLQYQQEQKREEEKKRKAEQHRKDQQAKTNKKQAEVKKTPAVNKPTPTRKQNGIEMDFTTPTRERKKEPDMSVRAYIATYGQNKGFNVYMPVEELDSVYSERKIQDALDRMIVIESNGFYIIQM